MYQENHISRCFDKYATYTTDFEEQDNLDIASDFNNNYNSKGKTIAERIKIKKAIEKIMEKRRLKEDTDFL